MSPKQLIFIDDSGDAGTGTHGSSHLVMSAVVFHDPSIAERVAFEMQTFRHSLGWTEDHEFKFNKTKKEHIKQVLRIISDYEFEVYGVVVATHLINNTPKNLYIRTISEVLRLIPLHSAQVRIDGYTRGTNYTKKVASEIRKNIHIRQGQIRDIKFLDSKKDILIQYSIS